MDKTKAEFIEARERRKLTQREWAKLLDVSYSSVTKWESEASPAVPPRHVMRQVRTLDFSGFKLKLDDETQKKLAKKLAADGKSLEQYLADLLKAVLAIPMVLAGLWLAFEALS